MELTRRISLLFLGIACMTWPSLGAAQRRGTHLMTEVGGGYAAPVHSSLDGGLSLQTALGVGGKWRGFPPRFYLLGGARWASFDGEVFQVPTGRRGDASVSDTELFGGLRVVLPAGWILRVVLEGDVGANLHEEVLDRPGEPLLIHSQWSPVFSVGAGLQARYHYRASVGLHLSASWRPLEESRLTHAAGFDLGDEGTRTAIQITHTWHF